VRSLPICHTVSWTQDVCGIVTRTRAYDTRLEQIGNPKGRLLVPTQILCGLLHKV